MHVFKSLVLSLGAIAFSGLLGASLKADGTDAVVANPTFTGTAGALPDSWDAYPPAKNAGSSIGVDAGGGVHIVDADTGNGLGLGQWVPITGGHNYQCTIESKGTGDLYVDLMFLVQKPSVMAGLNKEKLVDRRVGLGKTPAFTSTQVELTAPPTAATAFIWLYSAKAGTCDAVVKSVKLTDLGEGAAPASTPAAASSTSAAAPAVVAPATPAPASTGHFQPALADNIGEPEASNATPVPMGSLPKGIIQVLNFETGDISQASWCEGGRKSMSTDPVRLGKYALEIALVHGQKRSEIDTRHVEPYGNFKYGWSIFIPKNFDDKTWFSIVSQWHTYGTGKDYKPDGGPPTSISISKNKWSLKIQYQDGTTDNCTHKYISFGDVDSCRGKWTDFVMDVNWQSPQTGGGYLRLYKNGEKVVDYTGPTWFDGKTSGPYFKTGIYRGSVPWKGDNDRSILYVDEMRVGGADATLADVDPAKQKSSKP